LLNQFRFHKICVTEIVVNGDAILENCAGKSNIQGPPPKKCIHTLTKENSMFYVSIKFNYTSQVEYKLQ